MKVDFDRKMLKLNADPIQEGEHILTLRDVCLGALLHPAAAGKDGPAKLRQYELALRVQGGGELTTEDIVEIKRCVGIVYPPLVVGQAWRLLEGQETGLE